MSLKPSSFITLGTGGGPIQDPERHQPAHVVMNAEHPVLVDCGDGAIGQLMRVGIDPRDVNEIFLTHHHFDHIGGLFALLGVCMMTHRKTPLSIYGPPGTIAIVDGLVTASAVPQDIGFGVAGQTLPKVSDFVDVHELTPGDVIKIGGMSVSNCENTHYRPESEAGTPGYLSLSYRFDLADRSIVFTGDTGPCKAVEELAKGVDLVVGELMDVDIIMARVRARTPDMPEAAIAKIATHIGEHHISAEQLGDIAAAAQAKHVVAVHIPPKIVTPESAPEYAARIGARFGGKVSLGNDLDVF